MAGRDIGWTERIAERLLDRFQEHYILVMMIGTRLFGSLGGLLVIYYVELALTLPAEIRVDFRVASVVVVVVACALTVLLALWETRRLRRALSLLKHGLTVPPDELAAAGREAVIFVGRHHRHEAWLVPCSTLVPVLIFLHWKDAAGATLLATISLTVFMGISLALMSTFFAVEKAMQPVIRRLLVAGATLDYHQLPQGRLHFRFRLCTALIILITALMISLLARQRAIDIIDATDEGRKVAVANLLSHSMYITVAAVLTGIVFTQLLSQSVSHRVEHLVKAMNRVSSGKLSERLQPTGTDEIDQLTRQFNTMVATLENNQHTIQDLNANLEEKVKQRTAQLEEALCRLRDTRTQMTDLAHRAGMAEVATGVLHNVGNVLNSVNVSAACIKDQVHKSRRGDLQQFVERISLQSDPLSFFATSDKVEKTLAYLTRLAEVLHQEETEAEREIGCLVEKIGHAKGIINTQQKHARRVNFREEVDLPRLLKEILGMYEPRMAKLGVIVELDLLPGVLAVAEKASLVQIFDNLIRNALDAMAETAGGQRVLRLTLERCDDRRARVTVSDTGCGISKEQLSKIFSYGFTTKRDGNGFGLHSSALAVASLSGRIRAESSGPGLGSTFSVEFSLTSEDRRAGRVDSYRGWSPAVSANMPSLALVEEHP